MGLIDMCFFNEYEKKAYLIYVSFLNSVTLSTNSSNYIVFIPLHTRELWVSEPYHSPGLGVRIKSQLLTLYTKSLYSPRTPFKQCYSSNYAMGKCIVLGFFNLFRPKGNSISQKDGAFEQKEKKRKRIFIKHLLCTRPSTSSLHFIVINSHNTPLR